MDKNPVSRNLDIRFVKDLIFEGEGWNLNKLKKYFDGASVEKIIRTPVSLFGREDRFSWPFRIDGNYTIKTRYYAARNERSFGNTNNPSSSEDLKITSTHIRPICLQEPETTEHALLLCPWTRAAWFGAQIQCCPTALTKSTPNPIMVIRKAKLMELEFAKMAEEPVKSSINATITGSRVTWRPPLVGWIKCNVDAVFDKAHSAGATAAVFRDHNGTLLSGINSTIVATSLLALEALSKVIIESDNQMLIQALKSHASITEIQVPREANSLAHEVAKLTGHGTLRQNWIMYRPLSIKNILGGDQLAVSRLINSS
ncbi:hypothetical protein Ahy_A10g048567 [Arachis hypogaea]|uniref:RNase H type-1 domain-containing protein n=1 Tax=Arachis hypogaea TaxID=3818 RepID=A0A445B5E2_ARAHY|nr:hypothetical protein Ahy_A10g048567 [Arachis hypogaea]